MKELVSNLPAHLRQQVLKKEAAAKRRRAGEDVPESEEEDEEDSEEEEEGWGRKKKTYWEGDTADLEIGQEMEDAMDEEEAAEVHLIYINISIYDVKFILYIYIIIILFYRNYIVKRRKE